MPDINNERNWGMCEGGKWELYFLFNLSVNFKLFKRKKSINFFKVC